MVKITETLLSMEHNSAYAVPDRLVEPTNDELLLLMKF